VAARGGSRPGGANAGPAWGGRELRREDGTYEIQPNDSFWTISEKLYGTGAFFKALAEHNRKKISQEDRLPVGEVIAAPDVAQLEKAYPELCPKPAHRETDKQRTAGVGTLGQYATGRSYVVQEGDTLFDIARNELGKASRWAEIYELNRDQLGSDYNYLPRGLQLVLPPNDSTGGTTHRPGTNPLYRR
jgi:nucleoid-associated protein YgaU